MYLILRHITIVGPEEASIWRPTGGLPCSPPPSHPVAKRWLTSWGWLASGGSLEGLLCFVCRDSTQQLTIMISCNISEELCYTEWTVMNCFTLGYPGFIPNQGNDNAHWSHKNTKSWSVLSGKLFYDSQEIIEHIPLHHLSISGWAITTLYALARTGSAVTWHKTSEFFLTIRCH